MTYQRINEMPASEIAVHMGSSASVQEAERLRRIAMKARWGDAAVEDVPDTLWFHWVGLAAQANT